MIIDLEKMMARQVIYAVVDNDNKVAYIGLTGKDALTRLGQHLDKNRVIKKYIKEYKPQKLEIEILFQYKRNHQDIYELLDQKESYFMQKYAKLGYKLLNTSKMKKLGIDK